MSRIEKRFEQLKSRNEKALVAFITAGDPDLESTRKLFTALEKGGADIVELGVPFSDPLADGPVIQKAALRALKSGTSLKKIIALVAGIRKESQLPIVLMTSFNPVFVYGANRFVDDAVKAGVDGIIVPDLPPEEAGELESYSRQKGLDMIFLLAPTSTEARVKRIGNLSSGFIYYVSLTGTTGTRDRLADGLKEKVEGIKKATPLPVLVGFGISGPEQAGKAAKISDGVVVGSAIVRLVEECQDPVEREKRVISFVKEVKRAVLGSG
ncbi:MAG: tryptophan synthase subunit alpha [Nitrospinae bacterium]|nr:tryptophan synthase subunit alpha [Nitrospinota bacterium]